MLWRATAWVGSSLKGLGGVEVGSPVSCSLEVDPRDSWEIGFLGFLGFLEIGLWKLGFPAPGVSFSFFIPRMVGCPVVGCLFLGVWRLEIGDL
jgi:hypothetical protein